ncbi:hypothetical protein [Streptosporangium lutulentum]|uniref:Uncharacterized protein n=1 Tax=Streptosporangium lutulentum TaxID=1461250 RepID=A0ABT9QSK2_9ACTN|nr:hypothetical protein [Streptosporangium lutulentum]MDP9849380.1 hypothetical protein [Streptosporangium lutulentum]
MPSAWTYGLRPDDGICLHIAAGDHRCPEVGEAAADRAPRGLGPATTVKAGTFPLRPDL